MTFRIGYRVPDGVAVDTELQHLAIFGLTQKSGKTTSLEGFAKRVGATALIFRTKRGDIGFENARQVQPYFRERVDWRYIEGLVSAQLQEKARFYRGDIILAVRGAKTVAEVHSNVQKRLDKAKNPWTQKVLVELNEYLTEVEDSLKTRTFATYVDIERGKAVVMDLEGYPLAMQQLVIASTLSYLMETEHNVIVVLPEARDFVPEDRMTPAKLAIENFIRKGATLGNYLWLDSQSLTGLDMDVMRHVGLWLFGRQTLDLEVHRDLKFLPGRKHSNEEVTGLELGQFLVVEGESVTKTYVQPAWLDPATARGVSMGRTHVRDIHKTEEENVDAKERKQYEDRIKGLETLLNEANADKAELVRSLADEHRRAEANAKLAAHATARAIEHAPGPRELAAALSQATSSEAGSARVSESRVGPTDEQERVDLHVSHSVPNLTVHVKEVRLERTTEDLDGKLAKLITESFFNAPRRPAEVRAEFIARGWPKYLGGNSQVAFGKAFARFAEWGFFRVLDDAYQVIPEAMARVHVITEPVNA